jgi:hypothetical protein
MVGIGCQRCGAMMVVSSQKLMTWNCCGHRMTVLYDDEVTDCDGYALRVVPSWS